MLQQFREWIDSDKALTDILVAVFKCAANIHRIVGVDELNSFDPSNLNEKIEGLFHAALLCNVMPCCKDVTGIKTDTHLGMVVKGLEVIL